MADLALVVRDLAEARSEAEAALADAQARLAEAQADVARLSARVTRLTARRARLRFLADELVGLGLVAAPVEPEEVLRMLNDAGRGPDPAGPTGAPTP